MIITKLQGGLANQLFQWAYGKSLSEKYNTPLYLDVSFFMNTQFGSTKRDFSLNKFPNLNYNILPNNRDISSWSNEPDKTEKLINFIFDKIKIYNDFLTEIELKNISHKLSIDNNKKISDKFKNFNDYDNNFLIHGNHITSDGKSKNWKDDTFNKNIMERITPMLKKLNYL